MTVLSLPAAFKIRRGSWGLRGLSQTFESPLNRSAQTQELVGAQWVATLEAPPLTRVEARTVKAFLVALGGGQAGRFYLVPPDGATPLGTAAGSPVVAGAGQSGRVLHTSGWTPGATLKAGDYISFPTSVGQELKMVTADVAASGSPQDAIAIPIGPPIRTAPANGVAVTVTNPSAIFRLADDDQAQWAIDEALAVADGEGPLLGLALQAVESFFGNV